MLRVYRRARFHLAPPADLVVGRGRNRVEDGMIDSGATPQERDRRSLRLTEGPLEFREDRIDQPNKNNFPRQAGKQTKPVQAY